MAPARTARVRAGFLLALLVCGPSPSAGPRAQDAPEPPPVLRIRGADVPWAEYAAWLVREHGARELEAYVRSTALERAAAQHGVQVTEVELEERLRADALARVAQAFGGNVRAWRDELERLGSSEELYYQDRRGELRQTLLLDALARALREPDEATLRAEWTLRHGPDGQERELELLHLRVEPPIPPPGSTRDEVRALDRAARELVRERAIALRAAALGGEPFAELVRRHSEDPVSRARGGRLLDGAEVGHWTRTVRDAVHALAEGEISEPLWSRGGWNLLRVARLARVDFEAARGELLRTFRERPASAAEAAAVAARFTSFETLTVLPEMALEPDAARDRLDAPVAEVDGEPLTRRALGAWLLATRGVAYARTFVERRTVEALARERGIAPGADELAQRLLEDEERLIGIFHKGDRGAWIAGLAAGGRSREDWMRDAAPRSRHELLAERILRGTGEIPVERVRALWERRHGPGGRNPRVRFLVRGVPASEEPLESPEEIEAYLDRELARLKDELRALRTRILEEGLDFPTLARRLSDDPLTRGRGGEPEGRFRLHTWPEHVQEALRGLRPGELSEPLELTGGLVFLFELVGIVDVPFESVEAELRAELEAARPSRVELVSFVHGLVSEQDFEVLPGLRETPR